MSVRSECDFNKGLLLFPVCPAGIQELHCDPMLCSTKSCPGQKDVTCRVNSCGKCEAEFLDKNGRKVDCKCRLEFLNELATVSGYVIFELQTLF